MSSDDQDQQTFLNRFKSVFSGPQQESISFTTDVPEAPPKPVFAIGDIHGRYDLLLKLMDRIFDHADGEPGEIIFLGDYIDRGSESREVIEYLSSGQIPDQFDTVFLKGNHEETILGFLDEPMIGPSWMEFGGAETLLSYGTRPPVMMANEEAWAQTSLNLKECIPDAHLEFLMSLETKVERGGYFFAHAGVNPSKRLSEQDESDLLWIRSPFLKSSKRHERIVVHGHTPAPAPHCDHRRIGVDTGAYQSGILTAAVITTGPVQFLATD